MELIKFIFQSFWHFLGTLIIISGVLTATINLTLGIINSILRFLNVRKLGYPPPHCDANGEIFCIDSDEKDD